MLLICHYLMYNHGTNDHGIISVFIRSSTVVFEVVHTLVCSNQQMCTIIKLYAILSTIDFLTINLQQ